MTNLISRLPCDPSTIPPRPRRFDAPINIGQSIATAIEGDPIWWAGRQWCVTEAGMGTLKGQYFIAKDRLTHALEVHGWPTQLGLKIWTDTEDFCTAWLVALALHGANANPTAVREAIKRSPPPRHQGTDPWVRRSDGGTNG